MPSSGCLQVIRFVQQDPSSAKPSLMLIPDETIFFNVLIAYMGQGKEFCF